MPAPRILVEESVRRVVPGAEEALPRAKVLEEALAAASRGERVLIAAEGAWVVWRAAAREAWMRGDNYHVLEAVDPLEAELAGVGYGQLVVARAAYHASRRVDRVAYEKVDLASKRVTRRALLSRGPSAVFNAVEKPFETEHCSTMGVDRACRYCLEDCGGASCAAALCATELLQVAGYSREGLHDYLRVLSPRGPGFLVFASRWDMAALLKALPRGTAPVFTVPVACPYVVGLEEALAARALGLKPIIVESREALQDPYCRRSREPYTKIIAGDYERLTGEKLLAAGVEEAAKIVSQGEPRLEPVEDAKGLLTRGLHGLAAEELERLNAPGTPLRSLFAARIHVYEDRCTLCSACVQECPTEALTLRRTQEGEELLLLPARCIACSYCVEVCPEDAMALVHEAPGEPTRWRRLAGEDVIRCLACGAPVAPRSLVVKVLRRMKAAGLKESALYSVLLCDRCRGLYQLGALRIDEERAREIIDRLLAGEGQQ